MGWRGALRSLQAASRASQRERDRQQKHANRLHDQVDRTVGSLNAEIERDLAKIAKVEERMLSKPISMGGLRYDVASKQWRFKKLADHTGKLTWSIEMTFEPEAFVEGQRVTDGTRQYELIACAATRWGYFAAFRVTETGSGRKTKLLNKTNPENNKVFLRCGEIVLRAIDGDLDAECPDGSSIICAVAFSLPAAPTTLSLEFGFKAGAARIELNAMTEQDFVTLRDAPSFVDEARKQFEGHTGAIRSDARATKQKIDEALASKSGCMVMVMCISLLLFAMAYGLGH